VAAGWPDHSNQRLGLLVEQHVLDHGVLDAEQPRPYPLHLHAVPSSYESSLEQPEP
jgi:hypothetical protein